MDEPIRLDPDDDVSRWLSAADPALGDLIHRVGGVEFSPSMAGGRFASLVRGVMGQQLSGKAAQAIYSRLRENVGVTPEALLAASEEDLLAAGLSRRKAEYVRGLAHAVASGDLDLDALDALADDEIVDVLTAQRGVGPWTAHMFLLFSMRRPDVAAPGDLGIRQATGRLLRLGRAATPQEVVMAAERWRPYRSAAMFYLYREAGMGAAARADHQ